MTWWQRVWRRRELEQRLDQELSFHLDQHIADLIARGLDPGEARRQARLALGGPEQVKEDCRDVRATRWLEDLLQDLRYALRTLRQRPGFAAVALLTLALGSGATTTMFAVLNGVLLKPLAYPDPDRLVTVHGRTGKYGDQWGFSYLDFLDSARESRSLAIAAWTYGGGTITAPGQAEYVEARQISSNLFSVLGLPLLRGRAFQPEEDRPGAAPAIIISDGLWQRRFGGRPSAIGASLSFDGKLYTVVGIAPPGFQLEAGADVLVPLGQTTEPRMNVRAARFIHVVARLRPSVAFAEAQAEVALISRRLAAQYPASDAGRTFIAHPLQQEMVSDVRATLWLLLGAVSLVLLIACVNTASLLLARAVSRERELAMRIALGAGRARLIRQCLTESAVLALSGCALGILIAVFGTRPFVTFWPGGLPRAGEIQLDWSVLIFAVGASLASGLLFGLAPALRAPALALESALRSGARAMAGPARRLHGAFIISEIGLAVVLLASAGMLGRTLLRLSSVDPGLNVHNLLTARVALSPAALNNPAQLRAAWQDFLERARRVPGVRSVALTDIVPMRVGENSLGYWTNSSLPPPDQFPLALASSATPDLLVVMGIPLRQGRFFTERDRLGSRAVIVVDENLARHAFGGNNAVGKHLWIPALGPAPVEIVGVAGHVRQWGLAGDDQSKVRDQLYYPFAQVPDNLMRLFSSLMSVAVRTTVPPLSLEEPLSLALRGPERDQALYEVVTMEQLTAASLDRQRFLSLLFGIFAAVSLLLACIGIYGVLAYLTSQRVPEIGLRMALGATAGDVLRLVLRESLGMVSAGIGLGLLAALAASRALVRTVPGMRSTEPFTLVVMTAIVIAAALSASFLPARRASRVDPMRALRQE